MWVVVDVRMFDWDRGNDRFELSLLMCTMSMDTRYKLICVLCVCGCRCPYVHIAFLCTKACRQLNVLQRMRGSLYYESQMAIYNSLSISNVNYCPVVWMFTSKSSLNKLENIQKRALRFVCNDFVSNYSELLENVALKG